jgi:inhibitor of KinA
LTAAAQLPVSLRAMGDCAVRVGFGDLFDETVLVTIRAWCDSLACAGIDGVVEWVPAYTSVTVSYDPEVVSFAALCGRLAGLSIDAAGPCISSRRLLVPAAYGGEDGPDLAWVAEHAGITCAEVIRLHSTPAYRVVMVGFLPGFPYLAGLDPVLAAPRLEQPRMRVPAGSVGIGGTQTGVYPLPAPGGWRIIGRTPVPLFDVSRSPAALLTPGDEVRFVPVDGETLAALDESIRAGRFHPSWENAG